MKLFRLRMLSVHPLYIQEQCIHSLNVLRLTTINDRLVTAKFHA